MSVIKRRKIIDLRDKDPQKRTAKFPERRTGKFLKHYFEKRGEFGSKELAVIDVEAHYVYEHKGVFIKYIDDQVMKKRMEYLCDE